MNTIHSDFKTTVDIHNYLKENDQQGSICYSLEGNILYGILVNKYNYVICYSKRKDGSVWAIIMLEQQVIDIFIKDKDGNEGRFDITKILPNKVIDISNNGERWEGEAYNNEPFGWGTIWNSENEPIYKGFHFGTQHWGLGVEYYSPNTVRKFNGYWCDGIKQGHGILYDKKENELYNGIYCGDNQNYQKCRVSKTMTAPLITKTLVSIFIESDSCKNIYAIDIVNFPNLESFETGHNCFSYYAKHSMWFQEKAPVNTHLLGSFRVSSCPKLKNLRLSSLACNNMNSCEISDLPCVANICIGDLSFILCTQLIIRSSGFDDS